MKPQLSRYRVKNPVRAGAIIETDYAQSYVLVQTDGEPVRIELNPAYFAQFHPHVGGYYVKWVDGTEGFFRAEVFHSAYELIPLPSFDRTYEQNAERRGQYSP